METSAWRALSSNAQALYPWIKLEWKGPKNNNNGKVALPVRQAAIKTGRSKDTIAKAFKELQAKGFLVCTQQAHLGDVGYAKLQTYEITEVGMPGNELPRKLFKNWSDGRIFQLQAHLQTILVDVMVKQKPVINSRLNVITQVTVFQPLS